MVALIFFYLNGSELACQRVAQRVSKGGHNIPVLDIERRYDRGIQNLPVYMAKVDHWSLYDNSEGDYLPIAKSIREEEKIFNFELWQHIIKDEK